ncbi:MAG TPA: hypothetical protein VN256_22150 [Pyrinomonadaceae bacterium]|nr:hypothetical protein [Pyrinomonadaceae bacterium]
MTKRGSAFGLCVIALLLFSAAHFGGAQEESEGGNTLPFPQGQGAWVVYMSRSGGMRPARQTVSVNSGGEISVHDEHYVAGRAVVDCSVKVKLAEEDFLKLKEAVRASRPAAWRNGYSDKEHPICCDQPTTRLKFSRREARDSARAVSTSWYPGSSELRPADLKELAAVVQELWNKASARCEAGE